MSSHAPSAVTVRAPAKINLSLAVGGPRPDGFHPLNTVYQAISLYDDVRVSEAGQWQVEVTGLGDVDAAGVPLGDSNIAVRAGRLLARHHRVERAARIQLAKGIPVAGGMAGGSADAAATLVALDRLWSLGTSDDDLLALAAELGSDVPFALVGGSAHGTGRGERVERITDRGSYWWVVLADHDGLSTPEVYREFDRLFAGRAPGAPADPVGVLSALMSGDLRHLGDYLRNDLEEPAVSLRPELGERLAAVERAHHGPVLLSGSGPTVLALAASREDATVTRQRLVAEGFASVYVATGPVAGAHVVEQG